MERRSILKTAVWAGTAASSLLGGCLTSSGDFEYSWKHDVGGQIDAVSEGMVFARERAAEEGSGTGGIFDSDSAADGELVALDAETGSSEWTYGAGRHCRATRI